MATFVPDPPPISASSYMVGVGVRIVPAGLTRDGKAIRASIILSPVAADDAVATCGKKIDLQRWPECVEAMLRATDVVTIAGATASNFAVALSPVTDGDKRPEPVASTAIALPAFRAMFHDQSEIKGKASFFSAWQDQRGTDIKTIGEMWRRLIDPTGDDDCWRAIVTGLRAAKAGERMKSLLPEVSPGKSGPPDIRGMGRGQAALLLSLERGRSLLMRTQQQLKTPGVADRDSESNLAALGFGMRSYLTEQERIKAGPDGSPARRAAEVEAKAKYDQIVGKELEAQDALLKTDRETLAKASQDARAAAAAVQQKDVEAKWAAVAASGTKAQRKAAYESLMGCVTADNVMACLAAVSGADRGSLKDAIADSIGQHNDAVYDATEIAGETVSPKHLETNYKATKTRRAAQARFATLQSQPSLARLFNCVVDVLIPIDAFVNAAAICKSYPERRGIAGRARFGFLAASLVCRDATRQVWTASKFRLTGDGARPDAWACTRAEIDLFSALDKDAEIATRNDLIANGALSQIDGVVHIAAARKSGVAIEPRFDIISLDSVQAVDNRQTSDVGAQRGLPPLATLRTAGLALVDRWREAFALMQALRSLARDDAGKPQVIDADDLTVGYRMDVAVRSGKSGSSGELSWRSLCNRWIEFGDSINIVEPLLAQVIPNPEDRLAYDSAIMVMPAKLQKLGLDANKVQETAFVEDTVGHWTGPPIGVDANSVEIDLTCEDNVHALQLGHSYRLSPETNDPLNIPNAFKIPKLIFGGGYFFGLTPRLVAGVIRKFDKSLYQPTSDDKSIAEAERYFAVLPQPETGPRRFLRHERIEAPIVTTPEPILARVFDGVVDGLRETADTIVVRSQPKAQSPSPGKHPKSTFTWLDTDAAGKPVTMSYRVIVPPTVSAEFADRHGVFDDSKDLVDYRDHRNGHWWGPPDGLPDVDYNEPNGGFPVYGYARSSLGEIEVAPDAITQPSGDAIFRPRRKNNARRDPYYPDPAAAYIVIALRDLAGRLLPGDPLIVPVRPHVPGGKGKLRYPDVRPIVLEIVPQEASSGTRASHDRILGLRTTKLGADLTGAGILTKPPALATVMIDGSYKIGSGPIAASHVRVVLEPGESFEVDMWCLPASDRQLAAWFDVIEAAALVASVDAKTGEVCETCTGFAVKLKELQLDTMADFVRRLGLSRAAADLPICGPANAKMPTGALRCVADIAYQTLQKRPTPELAARRTVTVTHAIAQVAALPSIDLRLFRVQPAADATPEQASLASQTVAISGSVTVDRPTTGLFEILAEGASLVTNAFDDEERRRRTPGEVARGIWPRSPVSDQLMRIRDIYGFDVDAKGVVTLNPEQAVLLRIEDDLAPPDPGVPGLAVRDLQQLQQDSKATSLSGNAVRVNAPFTITDSRARILKLWAIAGARTAGFFRDSKGDVKNEPTADRRSPPQCVVVQATKAPAKLAPLTILPAFRLKARRSDKPVKCFVVEREVRLRIRVRRPWFSSGEGERLGIVMWPPDIMKGRIAPSGASVVRDYETTPTEQADIAMAEFRDDDLGPGGAFTSRWGLDPIKGGGTLGWLVPPSAFADLTDAPSDLGDGTTPLGDGPVYVPRASVPIPVDVGSGTRRKSRLEAALLTFVPRFDIDHESWFCDIDLQPGSAPEPFMRLGLVRYQPHAPAELRVSEPVVEWLQVPNRRTVTVSIDPKHPRVVKVEVTGNGSTHSAIAPTGYNPSRIESWTQRSVMKISVLRRRDNGVEDVAELDGNCDVCVAGYSRRAERSWIPQTQAEWTERLMLPGPQAAPRPQAAVCAVHPASHSPLSWSAEFALDDDPFRPSVAGTVYAVLVEEVQPMLPATYRDEPVESVIDAPEDRQELTWSGPRFAAIVNLSNEPLIVQPATDKIPTIVPTKVQSPKKR